MKTIDHIILLGLVAMLFFALGHGSGVNKAEREGLQDVMTLCLMGDLLDDR